MGHPLGTPWLAAERDGPECRAERLNADERNRCAGAHGFLGDADAADSHHEHQESQDRRAPPLPRRGERMSEGSQYEQEPSACDHQTRAQQKKRPDLSDRDLDGEIRGAPDGVDRGETECDKPEGRRRGVTLGRCGRQESLPERLADWRMRA